MKYRFILNGETKEIETDGYCAVINNKIIVANTFSQIKRKASIEAIQNYKIEDIFYLLFANGTEPLTFHRINKKAPNNTIIRGEWG